MAVQQPLYQLFRLRPSVAQSNMDVLLSVLWHGLSPGQYCGPIHRLDQIFAMMSHRPDVATLRLCPYYFDQVTYSLPTRYQVRHMESCNLRLPWFNSWASLEQEKRKAANREAKPSTGIHLSRLCQLQDVNTGRSISTKQYIHLMFGYH